MATYTPIPYWESKSLRELDEWVDTCLEIQAEDKRARPPGDG